MLNQTRRDLNSDYPDRLLAGGDVQSCQHLLDRIHRGIEFLRIARADHEIGVRLLFVVDERVAANHGVQMRDPEKLTAAMNAVKEMLAGLNITTR